MNASATARPAMALATADRDTVNRDVMQARYAGRVVKALEQREVGHDIEQRLRVARDLAVARARAARAASAVAARRSRSVLVGGSQGSAQLSLGGDGDDATWRHGLAVMGLVAALIGGLWAVDYGNAQVQISAAADIDAALLSDDLPPKAYTDAGFREFLRQSGQAGSAVQD